MGAVDTVEVAGLPEAADAEVHRAVAGEAGQEREGVLVAVENGDQRRRAVGWEEGVEDPRWRVAAATAGLHGAEQQVWAREAPNWERSHPDGGGGAVGRWATVING